MEYDFSTQGKRLAISLISVTFIGFLFYFAVSIIIRKCNQKIWTISEVIVEIIMIFMFIITSVSVLSSAMLFYPHFDEESYNKLQEEIFFGHLFRYGCFWVERSCVLYWILLSR